MSKQYALVECYPSVQGEGAQAGRAVTFVRFAGCDHKCQWCDTKWDVTNLRLDVAGIVHKVLGFGVPAVVFTGGEPALQLDRELVAALQANGIHCAIETAGYRDVSKLGLDWITVSPKSYDGRAVEPDKWVQRTGDEIKVVFPDAWCNEIFFEADGFKHHYVQPAQESPVITNMNTENAIKFCMQNPRWRLSVQTHKYLGVR